MEAPPKLSSNGCARRYPKSDDLNSEFQRAPYASRDPVFTELRRFPRRLALNCMETDGVRSIVGWQLNCYPPRHRWQCVPMLQELKFQVSTAVLTVITIAAMTAAVVNFQQLHKFRLADDGVTWVDAPQSRTAIVSTAVAQPEMAAETKPGMRAGDVLVRINSAHVERALDVPQILAGVGSWNQPNPTWSAATASNFRPKSSSAKLLTTPRSISSIWWARPISPSGYSSISAAAARKRRGISFSSAWSRSYFPASTTPAN